MEDKGLTRDHTVSGKPKIIKSDNLVPKSMPLIIIPYCLSLD